MPRFLLCFALLSACTKAPAAHDCERLFDHIVQLNAHQSHASEADKATFAQGVQTKARPDFLQRCQRNIKATQVQCALAAKTLAAFDACDE